MKEYQTAQDRWRFLEPWTAVLRRHDVTLSVRYPSKTSYCCVFDSVEVALDHAIFAESDEQVVAEAVDLLMLALTTSTEAWQAVLRDQCTCNDFIEGFIDDSALVAPRLTLGMEGLSRCSGRRILQLLMESSHRSGNFQTAIRTVLELQDTNSSLPLCTPMRVRLTESNHEAHSSLLDFVEVLEACNKRVVDTTTTHTFVLEQVNLECIHLGFQMNHAYQLIAAAPLVHIQKAVLDLQRITRSKADLCQLLRAAFAANPDIELEINSGHGDEDIADLPRCCGLSLEEVVDCINTATSHIDHLHVGNLTSTHMGDTANPWWGLFESLLHYGNAFAVDTLTLGSAWMLEDEATAALIEDAFTNSPTFKMPRSLVVELSGENTQAVRALIYAFRDVRQLHLSSIDHPIPFCLVEFILQSCTQLQCMDLDHVVIESMDVFLAATNRARLSSISLSNVVLRQRSSVSRFFASLPAASSLHEFRLVRTGDASLAWDKYVLTSADMDELEIALRQRNAIRALHLHVADDVSMKRVATMAAEYRQPLAVRRGPLSIRCKIAFVSAITPTPDHACTSMSLLSQDIVGHIFDYAAENATRWIDIRKSFEVEDALGF